MSSARHRTLEYLRRPRGAPWQWSEGGRVLTWSDDATIAFREEIQVVIERLAPAGLPSFAEIALLLAACRGKVPELPNFQMAGSGMSGGKQQLLLAFEARRRDQLKPSIEALRALGAMPPELVQRAAGKALLTEAVLEGRRQLTREDSATIVTQLTEPFADDELNHAPPDGPTLNVIDTIHHVGRGLLAHTAASLQQRIRTGLNALPRGAAGIPELPPDERARHLLAALRDDETLAGFALVARDLMAAVQLPQLLAYPDELALGGSADVSNRGSLDRLLISELVHDDATLAARVALNEALYLQREPPAQRPARSLVLILDVGIRLWGTPRVLSAAAALALIARHHSRAGLRVFRAAGPALEPVDLLERAGLEMHLATLRPDLHPGAAFSSLDHYLHTPDTTDVVVLTHRDVLADPDFQRASQALHADRAFALTTAREGAVQLWSLPWMAPRPLCEALVEVDSLLTPPSKGATPTPLIDVKEDPDIPAIFRVRPFPLLLPINAKMEFVQAIGQGGICVTADHRLLRWETMQRGARQLATDLPGGRTLWLEPDAQGHTVLVKGRSGSGQMAVVRVPHTGEPAQITRFTGPHHSRAVFVDAGILVLVLHTRIVGVAIATGEIVAEHPIEAGVRWVSGRYFSVDERLAFACWDGGKVRWESLAVSGLVTLPCVKLVFDRQGIGPWLLMNDGRVLSPTGSEHAHFGFAPAGVHLSDDGQRLTATRDANLGAAATMELSTKTVSPGNIPTLVRPAISPPTRNLQKDFSAIACDSRTPLRLQRKKGSWLELFAHGPSVRLTTALPAQADDAGPNFTELAVSPRLGCSIKVARWPNGSRAWLDSRGLLHLRSNNPAIPEVTLVLNSGGYLAAWSSDGFRYGPDFFHPESAANSDDAATELVSRLVRFGKGTC